MNEKQIVKWAAGAPIDLEESSIDDELLLHLIRIHRLEMRFWDRVRDTKLPWCMRRIFLKILPRCNQVRKAVQERIALTNEIVNVLENTNDPLITIKGLATYALLGQEKYQKYSNDIDVLFSDLPFLAGALQPRGFEGGKPQWASHEYSALKRSVDRSTIEPHRFFPVFSYPDSLPEDLVPEHNPGRWLQKTSNRHQFNIHYAELLANSQLGVAPGCEHLTVPNPSMAVLILCAHEFRDFLLRPCRESFIHLSTLADISDLLQHPQFEQKLFLHLIDKYHGHDSVRFVRYLCMCLLEIDPFLSVLEEPAPSRDYKFPQLLNYKGGWVQLEERPDDLLVGLSTAVVVERLEVNKISAPTLLSDSNLEGQQLDRVVIQLMDNADSKTTNIPFVVSAWIDQHLKVDVTLLDPLEIGFNHQIKLYSDDGINEFHDVHVLPAENSLTNTPPSLGQTKRDNVFAYWKEGKCSIQFSLPQKFNKQEGSFIGSIAITLVVTKWRWDLTEIFEAASPVIVAPLQLIPQISGS